MDITATEYVLAENGEEARFQGHTVDEFGKGNDSSSSGANG